MTRLKSNLIVLLPTAIFIINELTRTFIRPTYGQRKYGLLSDILGWLPNFLGSLGFMTIAIVLVPMWQGLFNKPISKQQKVLLLLAFTIIGLLGFLLHEITQKGTGLFYDVADIYATLAGIFSGGLIYIILFFKKEK
jgi:hypothetical protein